MNSTIGIFSRLRSLIPAVIFISVLAVSGCGAPADDSGGDGDGDGGGGGGGGGGIASVALSWDSPTTNSDDTCLTDLDGYKVYYGTSSGNYPYSEVIDIGDAICVDSGTSTACGEILTCTHTINGLTTGQWFFSVLGYNVVGDNSPFSGEATTTIN